MLKRRSDKLVILTYHRVIPEKNAMEQGEIDVQQFKMHVETFAKVFNVLKLSDAVSEMHDGGLPSRAISITFDDGYKDNVTAALPILEKVGVPATFFIATGFLDGGTMWNDIVIESVRRSGEDVLNLSTVGLEKVSVRSPEEKRAAVVNVIGKLKYIQQEKRDRLCTEIADQLGVSPPTNLMMDSSDLVVLRDAGMEIGGHTRNHPILCVESDEDAYAEIKNGKRDLEAIIGERVSAFAYPNGRPAIDYDRRHVAMVRNAGFRLAVTTATGCVNRSSDVFQLGRMSVWHTSQFKLIMRMLMNFFSGTSPNA